MNALARAAAGYVLDFFRERVAAEDFAAERVRRVLVGPDFDSQSLTAVRRLFPGAALYRFGARAGLWQLRRGRFDAVCLSMSGGSLRARLIGLLGGARHTLLIPSADYCYRLGMRGGAGALVWAAVDRFLLAPLALGWFGLLALRMHAGGRVGRALAAERGRAPWQPERVLVIRLMPTDTFLCLLRLLRERLPRAHIAALLASSEGRAEVAAVSDEVISPRDGTASVARAVRRGRFDAAVLAGGGDYGLRPARLKAAALAALTGAPSYQWEIGQRLPGRPLRRALLTDRRPRRGTPGPVGRRRLRRRYAREPQRGPTIAQIGLTQACNYHCLFCPFHNPQAEQHHDDRTLPRMSFDLYGRLLADLRRLGARGVDICGDGEPLMHARAMEMIELAREMGFDVTLATNAALLTEARARGLVDLGVRRMHVSLNAASDEVYEKLHAGCPPGIRANIVARLRAMAEYADRECLRPIDVEFSAVLNRLNMHEIPKMVEVAQEARARWLMIILMGPVPGAEELLPRPEDWVLIQSDLDRAARRARELGISTNFEAIRPGASEAGTGSVYERIPCHIGHEYTLILADGSVMFCCQCSRPLGNLAQDSFERIWYSEAYREMRRKARELPVTHEHLPGCECFTACSHVAVNLDVYRRMHGERALRLAL